MCPKLSYLQLPNFIFWIIFYSKLVSYSYLCFSLNLLLHISSKVSLQHRYSSTKVQKIYYKTKVKLPGYRIYKKDKISTLVLPKYRLSKFKKFSSDKKKIFFYNTTLYHFPYFDLKILRFKLKFKKKILYKVKNNFLITPYVNIKIKQTYCQYIFLLLRINFQASKTQQSPLSHSYWILRLLSNYLLGYTQNKVNWLFFKPQLSLKTTEYTKILKEIKQLLGRYKVKAVERLFNAQLNNLVYAFIFLRSITLFITWFIAYIKVLPAKRYKRFLLLIISFLKILIKFGQKFKLLQGFNLCLKGKLMGRGGTRKKKLLYRYGDFSLSQKTLKFNYKKFIIKTSGGVIGGYFNLFF